MPERRLGKRQLDWLILLSSVDRIAFHQDAAARSLVRRGLLLEDAPGGCITISAAGLRALADEMDAGRMQDALARLRAEAQARREKRANA